MRILIIEDSVRLADTIADALRDENYIVDIANDGLQGYENAASGIYDMLILDLMLPKMNGYEVLSSLRKDGNDVPVLILSARTELDDKIQGFTVGADDYVTKPFSPKELIARIKAITSRRNNNTEKYVYKTLEIDYLGHKVTIDNKEIKLTPKEYDLLVLFVQNKSIALSRETLLSKVWGYDFFGDDRTIDTHVKMLRNNLGKYRDLIVTVRAVGYKFEEK